MKLGFYSLSIDSLASRQNVTFSNLWVRLRVDEPCTYEIA